MTAVQLKQDAKWKEIFLETPAFPQTKASHALHALSKDPFDLTSPGAITPERLNQMKAEGAGYTLLYGFERVSNEVMGLLCELAEERKAIEQMEAMQAGEITNFIEGHPSENRAVLHTAIRDLFGSQNASKVAQEAAKLSQKEHEKLNAFCKKLDREKRFSEMIFVGIGGSELGPKALFNGLQFYHRKDRKVHFVCNVDPDDVADKIGKVDLSKTLVVVISKSGTTLETATNEEFLRAEFAKQGLDPKEHFVSVTMPKTPMDDRSRYFESFHVWDYVGGRFSSTSMV
ncbi:MAG TPA: glucose-6-phosphate isomerase, partial [Chlamydiales bacterium]|nr:glucose-6-phosphate isomerase [Chlamydiales bacterium]